jgi:hypothetical protein
VEGTGPFLALTAGNAVTPIGDLSVDPTPHGHHTGEMKHGRKRPQQRQSSGQISQGVGTSMPPSARIDDPHLGHQLFVTQIRIIDGDLRLMEGNEAKAAGAIQATEVGDLLQAEFAFAIVEHDRLLRIIPGVHCPLIPPLGGLGLSDLS